MVVIRVSMVGQADPSDVREAIALVESMRVVEAHFYQDGWLLKQQCHVIWEKYPGECSASQQTKSRTEFQP